MVAVLGGLVNCEGIIFPSRHLPIGPMMASMVGLLPGGQDVLTFLTVRGKYANLL